MKNGDKPAYPLSDLPHPKDESIGKYDGLTKREYIAAMAMQGMLANHTMVERGLKGIAEGNLKSLPSHISSMSVAMADSLLKELES